MIGIINELSLDGQFETVHEFGKSLKETITALFILNKLNVDIYKNQSFYDLNITNERTLKEIYQDRSISADEELRGLRTQLMNICYQPPFWDSHLQRHTCDDKYVCEYTIKTCEYGLAEALALDKLCISFKHDSFINKTLSIEKNGTPDHVVNISNLKVLLSWMLEKIEKDDISVVGAEVYFPNQSIANNILALDKMSNLVKGKKHEENIALYEGWGQAVAIIHSWKLSVNISSKNDRKIYYKRIKSNDVYLSIDTLHGTFELFNHKGNHEGEYNFMGEQIEEGKGHTITVS